MTIFFFILTESEEGLEKFLQDINRFYPNHKFTDENSKEKINFLDLIIKIKEDRIVTDLYCKPIDCHKCVHYDSCHADHIIRSIIISQTLRLKRICSEKNDVNVHVETLKYSFVKEDILTILLSNTLERPSESL